MNAIDQYNVARDRETHAFDVSEVGERVRTRENGTYGRLKPVLTDMRLARDLALIIAFCSYSGAMPAWYAGRRLRYW